MKTSELSYRMMLSGVFIFAVVAQMFAQEMLPEVTVTAARYKYLNAVNPEEAAQPVNMLEQYAAEYDLKGAEFYEDEYDNYVVSFFIPQGRILAAYDKDGKLFRTAERYNNVALPSSIKKTLATQYPNWTVSKDVYVVTYAENGNPSSKKVYKLLLENNGKRKRLKIDDMGTVNN